MQISHEALDLELAETFTISRSSEDVARNRLVRLTLEYDGREITGLGECPPHAFIGAPLERCVQALDRIAAEGLGAHDPFAHEEIEARLIELAGDGPPARAAVMMAVEVACGRILGQPLWRLWGLDPARVPPTSFTIGMAEPDHMVEKARRARAAGYSILKIKLGTEQDLEICRAIIAATGLVLRVDANCAWTPDEAVEKGRALAELGVELIEQPIPPGSMEELRRVTEAVPVPVIADESCLRSVDAAALAGSVDGVNIKLSKCGGLREAMRIVHTARAHGMKVMLGCNIESSISITAAAHLAPLVDIVDLDGNLLLAHDPYCGVKAEGSRLVLPTAPGLGVEARE